MQPAAIGVLTAWLLLGTWCTPAFADGGTIFLSSKRSGYQITVFTRPTPFRSGPVDISVLIQDSLTGEPLTGPRVTVRMSTPGQPPLEYPATTATATNKLFQAAQFELPEPGRWHMEVEVEGSHGLAMIDGDVEAAKALPRWQEAWPWFSWPAGAIALFGIHRVLVRSDRGKPGLPRSSHTDTSVPTI